MCQLVDSFVILEIKYVWSASWKAYKLHCVENGIWQNKVREDAWESFRYAKEPWEVLILGIGCNCSK